MYRLYSEGKQHQPQNSRTCSVYNKALQTKYNANICTTLYAEEYINNFYSEILGKPTYCTIVMGDFNAQIGKRTSPVETAMGKFGFELRNERGDTLVERAASRKSKITNTVKNPRPEVVIHVTVINQVNIGSDHRMAMSNIKLDVEVERKK